MKLATLLMLVIASSVFVGDASATNLTTVDSYTMSGTRTFANSNGSLTHNSVIVKDLATLDDCNNAITAEKGALLEDLLGSSRGTSIIIDEKDTSFHGVCHKVIKARYFSLF